MQKSFVIVLIAALVGAFVFFQVQGSVASSVAFIAGIVTATLIFTFVPSSQARASDEPYVGPTMTLYVGNLPYRVHEGEVKELFGEYGPVNSVRLVRDRKTGRRKGFGFVEMSEAGAQKAMGKLNDYTFQERTLKVREAKSQESDSSDSSDA
ncbi:RNA recognition motif domain-containing protein [Shewanella glacialimarina]|jgi:RNA recognition motif-containing protein|uniref:RNA recognition motif domain-containing protein n=1 Tax=Shewanella glacialimarina TaxID=2590884 RepID=UPI001CF8C43D|nr:RNA-binding protein [Shewanella glacialimarina]UCX03159.1 RNA-binding protein [Shewanella glacialimarina]